MANSLVDSFYTASEVRGVITFNVTKRISVKEFREILIEMKRQALEKKLSKLLLNVSHANFDDLTMLERHDIGLAGAEILKADFRIAVVVQKQNINKHGENVANNRGADVFVTHDLDAAYDWLLK